MIRFVAESKQYWTDKKFSLSVLSGLVMLIAAIVFNYYMEIYATNHVSNHVADLLLDILPVVNMDLLVVQGAIIFMIGVLIGLIIYPRRLPFILKSVALFISIRSIFITLTHMAPYLGMEYQQSVVKEGSVLLKIAFGGDLFFSGHTGLPFLLALAFWHDKYLRFFFLASSIIAGAAMLLGHLHYSIDVFAAFFITYAIFHAAKHLFTKDYLLFMGSANS